ncbi:hypothetical protein Pmani_029411 [Petrolisthes manimaculis]|uniref:Uncharacterized protein n=1 Tax=Petrolisthes manimaculis TaxID=1843537 RepID=A0AAE1NZR8_9EUCA|nr:hypothetical protein Pmani_029411 [Petrolisthes manimaculis]
MDKRMGQSCVVFVVSGGTEGEHTIPPLPPHLTAPIPPPPPQPQPQPHLTAPIPPPPQPHLTAAIPPPPQPHLTPPHHTAPISPSFHTT